MALLLAVENQTKPAHAESETFLLGEASAGFDGGSARLTVARGQRDVWLGVDAEPTVAADHAGGYVGARLGTPHVELRAGVLGAYSFRRSFLPIQPWYRREDAELRHGGEHARYLGLASGMALRLDAFGGEFRADSEVSAVLRVPEDRYVFVEHRNVITGESWLFYQRVGQRFPIWGDVWMGAAAEYLWLDTRHAAVLRVGPDVRFAPRDWFAVEFVLLPAVTSPDRLGLSGATFDLGLWVRFW